MATPKVEVSQDVGQVIKIILLNRRGVGRRGFCNNGSVMVNQARNGRRGRGHFFKKIKIDC